MTPVKRESEDVEGSCRKRIDFSFPMSPPSPHGSVVKEPSALLQLRSHYRMMKRMHPYADEKMKIKDVIAKVMADFSQKNQQTSDIFQEEINNLRNRMKSCKEQIDEQEEQIKQLKEQLLFKDEKVESLEKKVKTYEIKLKEVILIREKECKQIEEYEEKIAVLTKEKNNEENKSNAITESTTEVNSNSDEKLFRSQVDKVLLLEEELRDLNATVKKQDMQIQFLEYDLQYKDKAASSYTENAQRQEIKIQFLNVELNYRKLQEDSMKQDIEKLSKQVAELTNSANNLKCENLSLSNILKEMKSSNTQDGCSSSEDFCCETVKQVKLSFIDMIETEFECVICHGMFIEATVTTCNHMFCNYCLSMWRKRSPNCPICRSIIKFEIKTTIIDNYILNAAKRISEKMFVDRRKMLDERFLAKNHVAKYKRLLVSNNSAFTRALPLN